jgi:nitroreductase
LRTRRSVRGYSDKPVADEVLRRVLGAARMAPSANNKQPWHFILVRQAARRARLAELCSGQSFVGEAPVVVVFAGKRYVDPYTWIHDNMFLVDVTIAVDHFTLAARAEGLGTCWIGAFEKEGVQRFCALPALVEPIMISPLGYPSSSKAFHETTGRKALENLIHEETF